MRGPGCGERSRRSGQRRSSAAHASLRRPDADLVFDPDLSRDGMGRPLLLQRAGPDPFASKVAASSLGGLFYSVGAVMNLMHWPALVPGVFAAHEIFHFFVISRHRMPRSFHARGRHSVARAGRADHSRKLAAHSRAKASSLTAHADWRLSDCRIFRGKPGQTDLRHSHISGSARATTSPPCPPTTPSNSLDSVAHS